LVPIPIDTETFARAYQVQRELAHAGGLRHRSVKIADLIIAAAAELSGTVLWHYDDYDRVAAITGQRTEWIATRATV
jgi:predicted nucleic acid-binding protein